MTRRPVLTRRRFMQGGAGLGGCIAALSFGQLFGLQTANAQLQDAQDTPQTIVNLAATAEALAITAYYATLAGNPLKRNGAALNYLTLAMTAELYHLNFLQSAGGEILTDSFYVPEGFLSDATVNAATFAAAETAFVGAYLAATRRFAELGEARLAATTAQHAVSEGEHLALSRLIGGLTPPNPNGLPAPIYYNVSDAVPTLVPFLQGGDGFVGPVTMPSAEAVNKLAGATQAAKIPTFTQVF
jgi:hypothetical protein